MEEWDQSGSPPEDIRMQEKQVNSDESSKRDRTWIIRCFIIGLAAVLPDRFPRHPHLAFGLGLFGALMVAYFIPPRGRHLWLLLAVAGVIVAIDAMTK